jgi:hypothetical protein
VGFFVNFGLKKKKILMRHLVTAEAKLTKIEEEMEECFRISVEFINNNVVCWIKYLI